MKHLRLYVDDSGESRFDEVEIELAERDDSPPAPSLNVSSGFAADRCVFVGGPSGWTADWHPAPATQWLSFQPRPTPNDSRADAVLR